MGTKPRCCYGNPQHRAGRTVSSLASPFVPIFWLKIGTCRWNRMGEKKGGRRFRGRAAKLFQVKLPLRYCPEFQPRDLRVFDLVKNPPDLKGWSYPRPTPKIVKGALKVVQKDWRIDCSGCSSPLPWWHTSSLILTGSRRRQQKWATHRQQKLLRDNGRNKSSGAQVSTLEAESRFSRSGRQPLLIPAECGRDSVPYRKSDVALKGKVGTLKTEPENPEITSFCSSELRWSIGAFHTTIRETCSNSMRKQSNVIFCLVA